MIRKLPFMLLAVVIALSGCNKRPKGVLSDKEMVQLIADMEVAEVYIQQSNQSFYNDSSKDKAVQWVLNKRGINKADFDSTITWYGKNIDVYYDLYAKVDAELAKREKKATGESGDIVISGSDLWPYSKHIVLSELSNSNSVKFSILTDEVEKGDRLNLKMRTKGLQNGSVLIGVDYETGPTSYASHNHNGNNRIDISLQTDSARVVKRIYGYVRAKDSKQMPVWLDSIALERLPIDSTQYYRIFSQRKSYAPVKKVVEKIDSIKLSEQSGEINGVEKVMSNRKLMELEHTK
ncbi:MAG: DUF4296 domain-containing protein [Muribaculaceae bacterium]|nr:DUF4296 domain-containing protein [Muribaculaceae bacterium]